MTRPLSCGQLRALLVTTCQELPDYRTGKNSQYRISDAALGAFGVFFTQTCSSQRHSAKEQLAHLRPARP